MKILSLELASNFLFLSVSVAFVVLAVSWLYRIKYSENWMRINREIKNPIDKKGLFYIVIPVLKEEDIIEETSTYFNNILESYPNSKIVFVSTSRDEGSTPHLAEEMSLENNKIIHFHYKGDGVMAHQLNHAIRKIKEAQSEDIFIAIYNADSRPDPRTFDFIFSDKDLSSKKAFQQYGDYRSNMRSFYGSFLNKSVLTSSTAWQNRWSLGVEIYNAIKNISNKNPFKPLSYCIGHGMILRLSVIDQAGGFSEETHNEDIVMGYTLNTLEENIYPIPFFDLAESPNLVSSLFHQKSSWFFGPIQFLDYYKRIKTKGLYKSIFLLRVYTFRVFLLSVYWLIGPTMLFILFINSLRNIYLFVIFILLYLSFMVIPSYISIKAPENKNPLKDIKNIHIFFRIFTGSFIAYTMHGISGYVGLFKYITGKIIRKKISKPKTNILR